MGTSALLFRDSLASVFLCLALPPDWLPSWLQNAGQQRQASPLKHTDQGQHGVVSSCVSTEIEKTFP